MRPNPKRYAKCRTCAAADQYGLMCGGCDPEPKPPSPDLSADRAYLNGLRAGFALGIIGAEQEFREAVESYEREIHNHITQA